MTIMTTMAMRDMVDYDDICGSNDDYCGDDTKNVF